MTKTSTKKQQAIATGWDAFEDALAASLAALGEGCWQYLILSDQRTERYVQFAVRAGSSLRAEVVSNDWLEEEHALGPAEQRALGELGWKAPSSGRAKRGDAKRRQNHSRDFDRPVDHAEAAALAVRTLRDVFQVPVTGQLDYSAFESGGAEVILPALGLVRRPAPEPGPPDLDELRRRVRDAVREEGNLPDLELDSEGELSFRYGSAKVMVAVRLDPAVVIIQGAAVSGLERTEGLAERLAELNRKHGLVRFFEADGDLVLSCEQHARPLVLEHITRTIEILGATATRLGPELVEAFGGHLPYDEPAQAPRDEPSPPRLPPRERRGVREPLGFKVG